MPRLRIRNWNCIVRLGSVLGLFVTLSACQNENGAGVASSEPKKPGAEFLRGTEAVNMSNYRQAGRETVIQCNSVGQLSETARSAIAAKIADMRSELESKDCAGNGTFKISRTQYNQIVGGKLGVSLSLGAFGGNTPPTDGTSISYGGGSTSINMTWWFPAHKHDDVMKCAEPGESESIKSVLGLMRIAAENFAHAGCTAKTRLRAGISNKTVCSMSPEMAEQEVAIESMVRTTCEQSREWAAKVPGSVTCPSSGDICPAAWTKSESIGTGESVFGVRATVRESYGTVSTEAAGMINILSLLGGQRRETSSFQCIQPKDTALYTRLRSFVFQEYDAARKDADCALDTETRSKLRIPEGMMIQMER
ncbi:MAG: hypothetical protein IOD12_05865 [Silvanigrellales bacterium]|nr:hypothetical protein [Silvanigrellales bacterium]